MDRATRLLVVDDEPLLLNGCRRALRARFDVVTSSDPEEALALLSSDAHFDAVLCDMHMPKMDGLDIQRTLKLSGLAIAQRFIWMSGSACCMPGPNLPKPFSVEELERALALLDIQASSGR